MPCSPYTNVSLLLVVGITELMLAAYFIFVYHSFQYTKKVLVGSTMKTYLNLKKPRLQTCEKQMS